MPPDDVRAALDAGQLDLGENYAQELRDKRAALVDEPRARWHYLGPLQRNKVKYLAGLIQLIQSVDDADILGEIDRRAAAVGVAQSCLVQVNVAGETRKGGVPPHRLADLLDRFANASHVTCTGLMLIPPLSNDAATTRRHFAALRGLAEAEAKVVRPHVDLRELSMGMSGDFADAVAEGATMVRVGTAIFGERAPH
jgi:pyridoxal phosphate enzyme (YggS family)